MSANPRTNVGRDIGRGLVWIDDVDVCFQSSAAAPPRLIGMSVKIGVSAFVVDIMVGSGSGQTFLLHLGEGRAHCHSLSFVAFG